MIYKGPTQEYLAIENLNGDQLEALLEPVKSALLVLWFTQNENHLVIDGQAYHFHKDEIICLTEFHKLEQIDIKGARLIKFNRAFYCIYNHDSEVGCKGLLFFGAHNVPRMQLPVGEVEVFQTVYRMFNLEFEQEDHLQLEMLQMMLKRFLILCARLYKKQRKIELEQDQLDLIREYNYLVEQHFRKLHNVADYADLLNKSPKTLSNYFKRMSDKTPLEFIKNRRMLEARRLLIEDRLSVKEVAYDLGFEDVQSFSRFFKREEGASPVAFKKQRGINANTLGTMA